MANWTIINYAITYNLNGGTVSTANPPTYTVATPTFSLTNPTRIGHTFDGWTWGGQSTPEIAVQITQGSTGNMDFVANWTANVYNIVYSNLEGVDNSANPDTYTFGVGVGSFADLDDRTGWSFYGWFSALEGSVRVTGISATHMGDVTVYARWSSCAGHQWAGNCMTTECIHCGYVASYHYTTGAAATCMSPKVCARNGCTHVIAAIDLTAHSWGAWTDWTVSTPATCVLAGSRSRSRVCNHNPAHIDNENDVIQIDLNNHNIVSVPAVSETCTDDGNEAGIRCDRIGCTHRVVTVIPARHILENVDAVAATCVAVGNSEGVRCTRGGCTHTTVTVIAINANNHLTENVDAVAATCLTDGNTAGVRCIRGVPCTHKTYDVIQALGHATTIVASRPPTCMLPGNSDGVRCSRCSHNTSTEIPIDTSAHYWGEWGEWRVQTPATCMLAGSRERSRVCAHNPTGHVINENVVIDRDSTAHGAMVEVAAVPETCTTDGATAGTACSRGCGHSVGITVVPAGHIIENVSAVAATCVLPGNTAGVRCTRLGCTHATYNVLDSLGHAFGNWVRTADPTCVLDGSERRDCGRCVDTETRSIASFLPINYRIPFDELVVRRFTSTWTVINNTNENPCFDFDAYEWFRVTSGGDSLISTVQEYYAGRGGILPGTYYVRARLSGSDNWLRTYDEIVGGQSAPSSQVVLRGSGLYVESYVDDLRGYEVIVFNSVGRLVSRVRLRDRITELDSRLVSGHVFVLVDGNGNRKILRKTVVR